MSLRSARPRRRRLSAITCAAGLLGVAATAAGMLACHASTGSPQSPELQALVKAIGSERRIEPRIAGGFGYGPLQSASRSADASRLETTSVDLRLATAQIEKALDGRRTAQNLHQLGVAYLLTGAIDRSIGALEDAAREAPDESSVASDLAGAYLVRGTSAGRPEDIAKAASRAKKATILNPSFAEAFFNRALAFEALSLHRDARETWERYLQLDAQTPWADEARRHLRALTDPPEPSWDSIAAALRDPSSCRDDAVIAAAIDASSVRTRDYFEDELLPSWGDAQIAGQREEAAGRIGCARALAVALARDGDRMALDAVNAIEVASRESATGKAAVLARAHQMFREGRRLFEESRFKEAESLFQEAGRQLQRSGSRFEIEASYFAARGAYRQQRIDEALAGLAPLIDAATSRGYWYLAARLRRVRGVIEESRSQLAAALEDYRVAATHYERIHDAESAAGVHNLLAEHLQTLGEPRESWSELFRALSLLRRVSSPLQRYQILWMAIEKCLHDDLPDIALHFQTAFFDNARQWPNGATTGVPTDGHIKGARIFRLLGDLPAAEREVQQARRTVEDVRDTNLAERWKTEILIAEGEIVQQSRPAVAVTALTDAVDRLHQTGSTLRTPYLFLLRGRARLTGGDADGAQADFQSGIDAFEAQHRTIDSPESRISHFDESWDVFGDMIRLQLQQRKRPETALAYVERSRAQTLLESVMRPADSSTATPSFSTLQHRIPRNVAVLSFATLSDELAAWVITDHSVDVVQQPVGRAVLEAKTTALRAALIDGSVDQQKDQLTSLYDLLIRPIVARIDPAATNLVIVPDGPLNSVPFSALIDRRTNRYLIEDRAIGIAPSVAIFVEMSARLRARRPETTPKLLIVGNPSINRSAYPNLATLEGARAEALEIAGMFQGAELLLGERATKERFLRSMRHSEVVHFAGHAVANQEFPSLSRLLFAPGFEIGSDTLFSRELAEERLDQLKLVVLAACSTGAGAGIRGEGVLSLARAFVAAGAPTVVASLWDVSDPASQRLFRSFYAHFRSGAAPVAALRNAQLAAIASADAADRMPATWAGFAAIGGF